ncbi:WD40/YVTN/BNR-like repeat-containing protein [Brevibacillus dissolubilis]|uniref:WD40/YVTN/BNR-like repeat-containing protein n=1 Tax=Brevibacillus dissolubilis TaxID=1844116 RepID=UPI001116B7A3|nr:YCF48-related protein [Brevibacillus dissolubilis]
MNTHIGWRRLFYACTAGMLLLASGCGVNEPTVKPAEPGAAGESPATGAPGKKIGDFSYRLSMLDEKTGWAYGRRPAEGTTAPSAANPAFLASVIRTDEGGVHWQEVRSVESDFSLTNAFFLDRAHAWVTVEKGKEFTTYHTADGGKTWKAGQPRQHEGSNNKLFFLNEKQGWLTSFIRGGANSNVVELLATNDGGETWKTLIGEQDADQKLPIAGVKEAVVFSTEKKGWMSHTIRTGQQPWMYRTQDGGVSWQKQVLPYEVQGEAVYFVGVPTFFDTQNGLLAVNRADETQVSFDVWATTDGGESWSPRALLVHHDMEANPSYDFVDPQTGWMATRSGLYYSGDGFRTWEQLSTAEQITGILEANPIIMQVDFVDRQTGWVVAGTPDHMNLYKTTDGGRTWKQVDPTRT